MYSFTSLKELINTLAWSKDLLTEMFEKRKAFAYRYEHAAEIINEARLDGLIELEVLRRNGNLLEIDDTFLEFFEQIMAVNEEINTATIHENIRHLKQQIDYYLQESNEQRKYSYLKGVKSLLRKIGQMTLRNIVDLNRNIDNTFKTEPNYQIKIKKLENYDQKRKDINLLISQTRLLLDEQEMTFFRVAPDEELGRIMVHLRLQLSEAHHNLIETQKQVIDFLNQIKYQSRVLEKLRQIKYLKDQFELRERSDMVSRLAQCGDLFFEPRRGRTLKLSLERLQDDDIYPSLVKISRKQRAGNAARLPVADKISADYLEPETEQEVYINLEELKNGFLASGHHLFNFVQNYDYPRPVSYAEKVTLYCQMISLYEDELDIRDEYVQTDNLEYAVIYPR